jgi:hypothetical protein
MGEDLSDGFQSAVAGADFPEILVRRGIWLLAGHPNRGGVIGNRQRRTPKLRRLRISQGGRQAPRGIQGVVLLGGTLGAGDRLPGS